MIVAKIPADQHRFFIAAIPWLRNEIFPECIIGGRDGLESSTAAITFTYLHGLAIIRLATSVIMNLDTYIVYPRVQVRVKYRIGASICSCVLNACIAVVSKVPTNHQGFFVVAIPWFGNEIFSEHIRCLRNCFKRGTAAIRFADLNDLAFLRFASSVVNNSHANFILTSFSINMVDPIRSGESIRVLNTCVMLVSKVPTDINGSLVMTVPRDGRKMTAQDRKSVV